MDQLEKTLTDINRRISELQSGKPATIRVGRYNVPLSKDIAIQALESERTLIVNEMTRLVKQ